MRAPLDCLCVADMCVDLLLRGNVRPRFGQVEQLVDDYVLELGGSANIFATQLARLGGSVGVIGRLGQDPFGEVALQRLESIGVDVRRVVRDAQLKTGLGVALVEADDRAILTYSGSISAVQASDLTDDLLKACRHWHIASYFLLEPLRSFWPGWLARLKQAGATRSLDTNWDPAEQWTGVMDLLHMVDVFLPNEAEAKAITQTDDVIAAGRVLAKRAGIVVIKCGARGAFAFQGDKQWECPAQTTGDAIMDTIGAGDNFDAGFIRGWLLGWPMMRCLELASRCGRESLTRAGGIAGQVREIQQ